MVKGLLPGSAPAGDTGISTKWTLKTPRVREGDKPQNAEQFKKAEERGYRDTNSLRWKEMHKAKIDNSCHPNPGTVLTTESL